jgi:hypothetical protein
MIGSLRPLSCKYVSLPFLPDYGLLEMEHLKVPKREIFVTELYTLSEPIWVGDLGTEAKNPFV